MNRQAGYAVTAIFSAAITTAALSGCASVASTTAGGAAQGAASGAPLTLPSASVTATATGGSTAVTITTAPAGSATGSSGGSGSSSLPVCASSGLGVTVFVVNGSQGMGHELLNISLININDPKCTVYGFPGFQLKGEDQQDQPGADQPTTVTWDPTIPKTLITLAPTAEASTTVRIDDDVPAGGEPDSGLCEPYSYYLAVTPPNNTTSVIQRIGGPMATTGITVCEHGAMDVLAFVPGATGPNQ
jgi:hypothetical protein